MADAKIKLGGKVIDYAEQLLGKKVSDEAAQAIEEVTDWEEIVRELYQASHMPAASMRDRQEVARIRQQVAQAAQAQMQQEQAMATAQMAAKVVPQLQQATQPGSPLEMIMGASRG
jgi:hypothetical protein